LGTAKSRLQPARIGYGTIDLDLNVNRDDFEKGMWFEGPNLSGPSDKTLAVVSLIGTDGMPIGVYMNYRMHPINFYQSGVLSGDYPSDAERWVERRFDDKPVAIFSQGSPGDQDMAHLDLYFKLLGIRAGVPALYEQRVDGASPSEVMAGMRKSMDALNEGLKKPVPEKNMAVYKETVAQTSQLVATYGTMIGESSITVMKYRTANRMDTVEIAGAQETVTCPGRVRLDNTARENALPPYRDGDPVNLKVGLLRIGDINLATVDADVYSEVGTRLKREAPASQTMLINPANGMATPGHLYVYSDAASSHLTFQVLGSRLKPGCAEGKIIDTVIGLMHKLD
jgi:neutral ceramidase